MLNHYGRIPVYKRVMHEPEERDLIEKFDTEFVNLEDNQIITTEGATIQAIYTPGHKKDHVSF